MDIFVSFFNWIIQAFADLANGLLSLFPQSPFRNLDISGLTEFMGYLNWLLPIGSMVSILSAWVVCKIVARIYLIIFRWIKVIE